MFKELLAQFDERDSLPVEIPEISDALISMGCQDKILLMPEQLDIGQTNGHRARWRQYVTPEGKMERVLRILYPQNSDIKIQRIICAKELVSACENPNADSSLTDEVMEFSEDIFKASIPSFKQTTEETTENFLAQGKALLLLFPKKFRKIAREKITSGDWTIEKLEKIAQIPAATLLHMLDPRWENVAEHIIWGPTKNSLRQIAHALKPLHGDMAIGRTLESEISELIQSGESDVVEFKSTLRVNLKKGVNDAEIEYAVLKTIAGFLNSGNGGTLLIGVSDDGEILGIKNDGFKNEDRMLLHLVNLVEGHLDKVFIPYIQSRIVGHKEKRILVVRCNPGPSEAFLKKKSEPFLRFFVRGGPSTRELQGRSMADYVKNRFPISK